MKSLKSRILLSIAMLLCAAAAFAQQQGNIDYAPESCILGGQMPLMYVSTADDGLLRSYFRRLGTTDWCSVDGKNLGKASNVTLPSFETGTEIEYYFVVLKGKQVVAKSPQIYKTKALQSCDSPFARHATMLVLECLPPEQNPIASALSAGFHTQSTTDGGPKPFGTPEKPERAKP